MPWFGFVPVWLWKALASLALVSGVYLYIFKQGEQKAYHKIEAANVKAVEAAHKGGAGTRNRSARGLRDPFTVD